MGITQGLRLSLSREHISRHHRFRGGSHERQLLSMRLRRALESQLVGGTSSPMPVSGGHRTLGWLRFLWSESGPSVPTRWQPGGALDGCPKNAQAVCTTATKTDGGSFRKVTGGRRDLPDARPQQYRLRENLIVEKESVGQLMERKTIKEFPAEGPEPGVILGEACRKRDVLNRCERAVRDVLIERHPAV